MNGTTRMTESEFDEAFAAVMPRLRHRLLTVTGNPYDADDLVQETYLRLSARVRASRLTRPEAPYAYAVTAAVNLLRDSWRSPAHRERCTDQLPDRGWDGGVAACEWQLTLQALLDRLTPKEAAAVILIDVHGMSHDAAAQRLGTHRGSVQRNRQRALAKLRTALGAKNGTSGHTRRRSLPSLQRGPLRADRPAPTRRPHPTSPSGAGS
ncbi:sigma-70 family RNA polymerase sigma factor [Streptomyces sp. TRM 70351]|uniref:RNA polymerase sigma factor n=1 Tax=Streptomyces sp. TRM 70351 TaxID=3116552 RepID=UPI002E7BE8F8|nr:sigma-70 family RNA polymerase sigma factor [Streptomyces sp. TRM 70351]MEE1927524.1 sigma-70 family RNA polymerase sigma factor [Streptomyces sp. TRM 70351]